MAVTTHSSSRPSISGTPPATTSALCPFTAMVGAIVKERIHLEQYRSHVLHRRRDQRLIDNVLTRLGRHADYRRERIHPIWIETICRGRPPGQVSICNENYFISSRRPIYADSEKKTSPRGSEIFFQTGSKVSLGRGLELINPLTGPKRVDLAGGIHASDPAVLVAFAHSC